MLAKQQPLFGRARNDRPTAAAGNACRYSSLNSYCKLLLHFRAAVLLLLLVAIAPSGCMVAKSRYTALETRNRALSEQNRAQLAEIENLTIHARNMEEQLRRSEAELAFLEEAAGRARR